MKKFVSLCLSVILMAALVIPADAISPNSMSPNFTYIWSLGSGLNISQSGKADCSGSVDASSNSYTAKLTITLQQSTSSGWKAIKSWSITGAGQGLIIEEYYYVNSGTYRVCSTAIIYGTAGQLLETESIYSPEQTC